MAAPKGNKYALGNKGGRPLFWTEEKILEEAEALLEWSKTDDAWTLREFAYHRGYHEDMFTEFCQRSEEFARAKKIAKGRIGVRRERGALSGEFDTKIVCKSWALYDDDMRAYEKELKEESTGMAQQQLQRVANALMNSSRDPTDMQNGTRPVGRPRKKTEK